MKEKYCPHCQLYVDMSSNDYKTGACPDCPYRDMHKVDELAKKVLWAIIVSLTITLYLIVALCEYQ